MDKAMVPINAILIFPIQSSLLLLFAVLKYLVNIIYTNKYSTSFSSSLQVNLCKKKSLTAQIS